MNKIIKPADLCQYNECYRKFEHEKPHIFCEKHHQEWLDSVLPKSPAISEKQMIKIVYDNRSELYLEPDDLLSWISKNAPSEIVQSFIKRVNDLEEAVKSTRNLYDIDSRIASEEIKKLTHKINEIGRDNNNIKKTLKIYRKFIIDKNIQSEFNKFENRSHLLKKDQISAE